MDLCRHLCSDNYYMPSAFYIKINVPISFDDNLVYGPRQSMAIFLHEYIHYLQDITTTYGYLQIHNKLEHLIGFLKLAQDNESTTLSRCLLHDIPSEKLDQFLSYTNGDADESSYEICDSIEIKGVYTSFTEDEIMEYSSNDANECEYWKSLTTPVLNLLIKKNHKTREIRFNFGAVAISESMAYLIQNHVYPMNNNSSRIIQYDIAKIFYNYIIDGGNDELVVELCDVSLMDNNPGAYFYLTLLCMGKYKYTPKNPGDIINFTNEHGPSFVNVLENNYKCAIGSISRLLNGDSHGFLNLRQHISSVMKLGMFIRNNYFGFIYKIMIMTPNQAFKYWSLLTCDLKLPFIINRDDECFSNNDLAGERFDEYFFLAYNTLYNILRKGGSTTCELVAICSKQLNDVVDENCENCPDPWNKLSKGIKCPLAVLWELWQLDEKNIIYNNMDL